MLRRPALYQMTGGPIEFAGGGYESESWVSARLGRPSILLEYLALHVIRQFDGVIVRGPRARAYLRQRGADARARVITGSVEVPPKTASDSRTFDLIFVGRLAPFKQPEQFVDIVSRLAPQWPNLRAAVLGDGPTGPELRQRAKRAGVAGRITWLGQRDDPVTHLAQSRVFVLSSRSEGLSIALAEALAGGAVPIVADVGELRELVEDGVSGYVVPPNDIAAFVARAAALLGDRQHWMALSTAARQAARRCACDDVSRRWTECFREICGYPIPAVGGQSHG
jgi:glycosyltransferase involved in cell wall biosynthesis